MDLTERLETLQMEYGMGSKSLRQVLEDAAQAGIESHRAWVTAKMREAIEKRLGNEV